MFQINDGRTHLWQWDINRKVIVNDPSIKQVHFSNNVNPVAYVVEVKDGLADIPNILLQDIFNITCYGYIDEYTKVEQTFTVTPRNKPSDYVYTETEVIRLEAIEQRINKLENGIPDAIEEYLQSNPPTVDLSNYYNKAQTDSAIETAVGNIDIPEIPTNVSAFANDCGYITEQYVNDAIAEIPKHVFYLTVLDSSLSAKTIEQLNAIWEVGVTNSVIYIRHYESIFNDYAPAIITYISANGFDVSAVDFDNSRTYYDRTEYRFTKNSSGDWTVTVNSATLKLSWFYNDVKYRTESQVNTAIQTAIDGLQIPDLSNYYNKTETDSAISTAIAGITIPTKTSDLTNDSNFVTETELNSKGYLTAVPDTYALKTDIPDVSSFTTMTAVEAKGYQTASDVTTLINNALGVIENGTY